MTQHVFQTEVQQLLHLMIHALYSNREIFLRELISNASDACDKLRFKALTNTGLYAGDDRLQVRLTADKDAKVITITDTGIGMTEADAIEHLGTIAKSGTKAFLQAMGNDAAKGSNLIGQFGVGFYSAFMVADRIVVESRAAGVSADQGVRWESSGDGAFTTEAITRGERGTTITLHLKEDAAEFADTWRLRDLVKKYSDFVTYPVQLPKTLTEDEQKEGKTADFEQVNAGQALWTRAKDQITDSEYTEFYKSTSKQWDEPATRLHLSVEGTLSFTALLFVPSEKPYDLFDRDRRGLSLYVRRVFIMDDNKDLLPDYLRFVRGVVDSDDLPLNVSREILQDNATLQKIRKQLTKKLLDHFASLAASNEDADKAAFAKIDEVYGSVLREALVNDFDNKDKVARLVRYPSTWTTGTPGEGETRSAKTGLEDYVRRMPEGQKAIYVVNAASLAAAQASPHLEGYRRKGYEVLFLTEPVDEWVAQHFHEFDKKPITSVAKGLADLADESEKKDLDEKTKTYEGFLGFAKANLGEGIKDVRLSARLTDSPCCLVGEASDLSPQMADLMKRMGQDVPTSQRVLELNPGHPLVQKLQARHAAGTTDGLADHLAVLRDQAILAEGGKPADPAAFAKRIQGLMAAAVG